MSEHNDSIVLWPVMSHNRVKELLQEDDRLNHSARFYISAFYLSDWTSHPRKEDHGRYWIDGKLYGKDRLGRINPGKYKDTVRIELIRILFKMKEKEIEELFNKYFYLE